jgi:excisionase family DNA binding protein
MTTLFVQREAAALLRLSERTLERMRVTGDGPPFVKAGRRVLYQQTDINEWIAARVRTSTSDLGQ